jgi:hypothetical protein
MGKLMINGEQYPAIVVKAGLDDTQTRKDATWSSDKINEELEDVRSELDIIVEEANKNTTINDEATSLTTTWSSKKTSDEITKHSLPLVYGSGIINNSSVQVYKLANVGYAASGGTDAYNLNLLLSSRGAEEIELIGGKNDSGWIIEAIRNNKSFNKITNIYQDGLDIYVRLDLRCNYFRVYHKSGVLSDNFAVSLVDTVPESATELTVTEYATKKDLSAKQDDLSARKVYVRRNSSANKYVLLATIDMRVLTNLGQPLRIKGVIGNMANDITNIDLTINARNGFVKKILYGTVTHKNFLTNDVNIIITKSDDGKTAYVYLDCISIYGYIDAEIYLGSVHYAVPSTFDLVGTMQGTEYTSLLDSNYVVIENVINDTSTGDTTSTWSSSKIASEYATQDYVDSKLGKESINDSITSTTDVWSSSKTKSYVDTLHPDYTSVAKGVSYDTGWKIKSVTNGDMCRIAVVNIYDYNQSSGGNKMATYLYLITANYTNTTTLNMTKITSNGNTTTDALFEFSVSSNGTIVFTNKSDAATDKMWVKLIKP